MKFKYVVVGLAEKREALMKASATIPDEVVIAGNEALQPIRGATMLYPGDPPSMAKPNTTGKYPKPYIRTHLYATTTTPIEVSRIGGLITAYYTTPRPYSIYLRGDGGGYDGAWMHRPFWESLNSIFAKYIPQARAKLEARIDSLLKRLSLS